MARIELGPGMEHSLTEVWESVVTERIGLHELHALSPNLMGLWTHGYDVGVNSMQGALLQARRDGERAWLYAMNGKERAAEIERRLSRALASCPPNIEPHSAAYFAHALRAVAGPAA